MLIAIAHRSTCVIAAYLYLDNNHLSGHIDAAIGNLTSLVDLRISGNMLTGVLPEEIQGMNLLRK
jgi:Leucine-rich repeat (LRR) protein